jgi:glycosyltransferase involved in cell wall biosynthesis
LSNPLVSILIPVYNKEEWILETLQSVLNQTYKYWECLIIDDGSTDNSLLKIMEFTRNNPANWKVVSTPNSGQTSARNHGIGLSHGELLAFLDADDLWHPKKIECQVRIFDSQPEMQLLFTPYVIFRKNQKNWFRVISARNPQKMVEGWLNMRGFGGLIESTGMIRRKALLDFGGFSNEFSMTAGLDLSLRVVKTTPTALTSLPLVYYRLSDGQFHKNEDVLIKDLVITSKLHTGNPAELSRLSRQHDSYLFWSACRRNGKLKFLQSLISSILSLDYLKLFMLYFLLSRNLFALLRGFHRRKSIRNFLQFYSLQPPRE